jgi:hypothetical protein
LDRRATVNRRALGVALMGFAVLWITTMVALYLTQTQYVKVRAQVTSKSCYQAPIGGNGGGTFTACNVSVIYRTPNGTPGAEFMPGVNGSLIHRHRGQETLLIYFSSPTSQTSISPQEYVPFFALILFVTLVGLPAGIAGVLCLRPRRSAASSRRRQGKSADQRALG